MRITRKRLKLLIESFLLNEATGDTDNSSRPKMVIGNERFELGVEELSYLKSKVTEVLPEAYKSFVDRINSPEYLKKFETAKKYKSGYLRKLKITPAEFKKLILDSAASLNFHKTSGQKLTFVTTYSYGGKEENIIPGNFVAALGWDTPIEKLTGAYAEYHAGKDHDISKDDKTVEYIDVKLGKDGKPKFWRTNATLDMFFKLEYLAYRYFKNGGKGNEVQPGLFTIDPKNTDEKLLKQLIFNTLRHELNHIENGYVVDAATFSTMIDEEGTKFVDSASKVHPYSVFFKKFTEPTGEFRNKPSELRERFNKLVEYASKSNKAFSKFVKDYYQTNLKRKEAEEKGKDDWDYEPPQESEEVLNKFPPTSEGGLTSNDTSTHQQRLVRMLELGNVIYWILGGRTSRSKTLRKHLMPIFNTDQDIFDALQSVNYEILENEFRHFTGKLIVFADAGKKDRSSVPV